MIASQQKEVLWILDLQANSFPLLQLTFILSCNTPAAKHC